MAWMTLAAAFLGCSHVQDGHTQRDVSQPSPAQEQSPDNGLLYGLVTTMLPPTGGPSEGRVPGAVPGGSSAPVGAAHIGVTPVGSSHTWWMVTSVDGSFAILLPPGAYQVTMQDRPGMGVARGLPATVTVTAGERTCFDIHLDTGLR